jgi:hypothetical protein
MTGHHALSAARSHAAARDSRFPRLARMFRREPAPVIAGEDFSDGMDVADAVASVPDTWNGASDAGQVSPGWRDQTMPDITAGTPRPYAAPEPAPARPRLRPLPPPRAESGPFPVRVARPWLAVVPYPAGDGTPEGYAAAMRDVSGITGTHSPYEEPSLWPRHAIEAGTGAA